jgi:small-conductance mechanosensitive channel
MMARQLSTAEEEDPMMQVDLFGPLANYFEQMRNTVTLHLPNAIGAIILVLIGWALATLLRAVSRRLMPKLYQLVPSTTFQRGLKASGMERVASESTAGIVYLLVWLLFIAAATETLGLPVVSTLVSALARYLPSVLAAVLIFIAGMVLANVSRSAILTTAASTGLTHGRLLGAVVRIIVLMIASVVAVDQIGIDSTFLMISIAIVMLSTMGGLAIGFGLGARPTVNNLLATHYILQSYRVGQRVRVGGVDGRIVQISNTAVILDTSQGRTLVPAGQFNELVSVLLPETE